MLVGVPYLTGYLLLAYGHMVTEPVAFKCVVLLGRFVTGIGLGWSCLAVPVSEWMIASVSIPGSCCFKLVSAEGLQHTRTAVLVTSHACECCRLVIVLSVCFVCTAVLECTGYSELHENDG